jgi:hypothetical protein
LATETGVALQVVEMQLDNVEEHRPRIEQRRSDLDGQAIPRGKVARR